MADPYSSQGTGQHRHTCGVNVTQTFSQQVHPQEGIDSNGPEGSWAWRDERDSLNYPKAHGPCCAAARTGAGRAGPQP